MGRGLDGSKAGHRDQQCLGLFIFYGGSKVKEVYQLHKDDDKEDDNHNNYQHAGAMVEKVLVSEKNETYESFKFWSVKLRTGKRFDDFTHRYEVAVSSCGYNEDDVERHVRTP